MRGEGDGRRYDGTAVAVVEFDPEVRSEPPRGRYAGLVEFGNGRMWSLGMEFLDDLDGEGWNKLAEVDFVAEDAPHSALIQGAQFAICEGPIEVGHVEIRVSSDRVPEGGVRDASMNSSGPRRRPR